MKQYLSVLIAITLALLIIGCSRTPDAGPVSKPLVIGAILPLTGTNALYGQYARIGMELAVEDINHAGGIDNRTVKAVYEDTGGDKAKAPAAINKLIDIDDADALITLTTPMAGTAAPIAEARGVPMVYHAYATSFTENKTYVFKDYGDIGSICSILAKQASSKGGIALLGVQTETTQICKIAIEQTANLTASETFNIGEGDFRTQIEKIKESDAASLFITGYVNDCRLMLKQIRESGFKARLYIPTIYVACGSPEAVEGNQDLLDGSYGADIAFDDEDASSGFAAFKKRIQDRNLTPTQLIGSAMVYDTIQEIAEAYSGCNDKPCATGHLRNMKGHKGFFGTASFNGTQVVQREPILMRFENGKWEKVK